MFAIVTREFVIFLRRVYWNVFYFEQIWQTSWQPFVGAGQMRRVQVAHKSSIPFATTMTMLCTVSLAHPTVSEVYNGDSALTDLSFCCKQRPFYSISPAKPWSMLGWMENFDISLVSNTRLLLNMCWILWVSKTLDSVQWTPHFLLKCPVDILVHTKGKILCLWTSAQIYLWLSPLKVPGAPGSFAYWAGK